MSSYKLIDGNEIPTFALGTSLGHLSDVRSDLPNNTLCNKFYTRPIWYCKIKTRLF